MLEPGESISGRYRIERVLGKGGMGAVYLGVMDSLGGKKFAIKEMEFSGEGHRTKDQALEQFRKEASFLANLEHPNLVQVTDFFAEGEKHYLVMAYVEGQTLQQRIEELQKPLEWAEMKPRMEALLTVLGYLHSQNPPIIFRDLKPSNVLVEVGPPRRRQPRPVLAGGGPVSGQRGHRFPDAGQRDTQPLRHPDERHPAQHVAAVAALVAAGAPAGDQALPLVEVQRRHRDPAAQCHLARCEFLGPVHDLNHS